MNKTIYYLKEKVSIGDIITLEGLSVEVTTRLIKDNPNRFEIKEDIPEYVECIDISDMANKDWYTIGGVYLLEVWDSKKHSNSWSSMDGFNIQDNSSEHHWDSMKSIYECFKLSTKEAYEQQELIKEAKKNYPAGTRFKSVVQPDNRIIKSSGVFNFWSSGEGITTSSMLVYYEGKWATKLEKLFTSEDNVDIYEDDDYWYVLTGSSTGVLSHSGKEKYVVYKESVGIGKVDLSNTNIKRFSSKSKAQEFVDNNREKTLEDYEELLYVSENTGDYMQDSMNKEFNTFYKNLEVYEPSLYWTKVLFCIQQDLDNKESGTREIYWDSSEDRYSSMDGTVFFSQVRFKTKETAQKAIDIITTENLDKIYKQ